MHEMSLVDEIVDACELLAEGRPILAVRVRRSEGIGEAELRAAWELLAPATAVAGASLEIEATPARLTCSCGFSGTLAEDLAVGHLLLCPECGRVSPTKPGAPLELLDVRVDHR